MIRYPLIIKITVLFLAIVIISTIMYFGYYYFVAEHIVFQKTDVNTNLQFSAQCHFSWFTYETYVTVKLQSGKEISKTKIPPGGDWLSDCTKEPALVVKDIVPDEKYENLFIYFVDTRREPVVIPLSVKDVDLKRNNWH